jgi:hypothetical protein
MDNYLPFHPVTHGQTLIAQIRRDIAAAWEQVEAGRAILQRSAWLLARWREQARAPIVAELGSGRQSMAGMFIEVVEERRPRRRARREARPRPQDAQAHPAV